jgi:hypothetical protein
MAVWSEFETGCGMVWTMPFQLRVYPRTYMFRPSGRHLALNYRLTVNCCRLIPKEKDLTVRLRGFDVVCAATSGSMHQKTILVRSMNPMPRRSMKGPLGRRSPPPTAGETTWKTDMCARSRKSIQTTTKFLGRPLYSAPQ